MQLYNNNKTKLIVVAIYKKKSTSSWHSEEQDRLIYVVSEAVEKLMQTLLSFLYVAKYRVCNSLLNGVSCTINKCVSHILIIIIYFNIDVSCV
jgi:hypothetical protein